MIKREPDFFTEDRKNREGKTELLTGPLQNEARDTICELGFVDGRSIDLRLSAEMRLKK